MLSTLYPDSAWLPALRIFVQKHEDVDLTILIAAMDIAQRTCACPDTIQTAVSLIERSYLIARMENAL